MTSTPYPRLKDTLMIVDVLGPVTLGLSFEDACYCGSRNGDIEPGDLPARRRPGVRRPSGEFHDDLDSEASATTPIPVEGRTCRRCGVEFFEIPAEGQRAKQRCPACRAAMPPVERQCVDCGESFDRPVRPGRPPVRCPACRG